MKLFFAAVFALTCVVAWTPSFAAGVDGMARGTAGLFCGAHGLPPLRVPNMAQRIPNPLPPPAQPPVVNEPLSPSGLSPMGSGL